MCMRTVPENGCRKDSLSMLPALGSTPISYVMELFIREGFLGKVFSESLTVFYPRERGCEITRSVKPTALYIYI